MELHAKAHKVRVIGLGKQIIVLGHGFGTDQSVWKYLVPHLLDEYRVILYDNMGAGTTNPDLFDFERYSTLEGFAYDLLAILEELQVDSCIFVGHSVSALRHSSPLLLNDVDYCGGFELEDLDQIFEAVQSNYKACCSGFAPLIVGDIALSLAHTIFLSDSRHILGLVTTPCHIIQSIKDVAVPIPMSEYLFQNLGAESIMQVTSLEGHLPQLSSPDILISVLLKHIRYCIGGSKT
ncbi:hypothetical protein ACB094_02G154700 [Castanea mollissima]